MEKITLNLKGSNNPFYGLDNCLDLFECGTGDNITTEKLDKCWEEVHDSKGKRMMFFSLLFSIGDITNRQHNIFRGKEKDGGGNSNREGFYCIFNWIKDKHPKQFKRFLYAGLFDEYTCFDLLFRSRVKTNNGKVVAVYDSLGGDTYYSTALLDYVISIIKGNDPYKKMLVAKFLTLPRLSKRKGHEKMLPETKQVMQHKIHFLSRLSRKMEWTYRVDGNIAIFKGYKEWRKNYNGELESVLFSTNKISEFTKDGFLNWYGKLPALARERVTSRIMKNEKWASFRPLIAEWNEYKAIKQAEQRLLEEKIRKGIATESEKANLEKVKKEAKVTVGAVDFHQIYEEAMNGKVDKLKLESFINKINLRYNSLVFIDASGSMRGAPFNFATFLASICLIKNPDDTARNLLGLFSEEAGWYNSIGSEPFVNPLWSFYENYAKINDFCRSEYSRKFGGWTDISTIINMIKEKMEDDADIVEKMKQYPVWTIISDGEWNELPSPELCINDLLHQCEKTLGFKPYIVAIDVTRSNHINVKRFANIDNFIYIPSNPAQIETLLTNFDDLTSFDIYMPLKSLSQSNRYELVRQHTF